MQTRTALGCELAELRREEFAGRSSVMDRRGGRDPSDVLPLRTGERHHGLLRGL